MDKEKQVSEFKVGDEVTYIALHGEKEHGIVKSVQIAFSRKLPTATSHIPGTLCSMPILRCFYELGRPWARDK